MARTVAMTAAGVTAGLVLGFGIPALAQDDAEAPHDGGSSSTTPDDGAREQLREQLGERMADAHAERQQELASRLAEELGLETDTVLEALQAVQADLREQWRENRTAELTERLAAAVAEGDLTQEQADAILAAVESGVLGGDRGPSSRLGSGLGGGPGLGGRGPHGPGLLGRG